ncbi:MAG: TolC family protein [Proteobacteria bacterium]|nr:TolC family protein [Pseudomonadota bacterium]
MLTRRGIILGILGAIFWLGLSPGPAAAEENGLWSLSQAIEYAQGHNPGVAVLESQVNEIEQAKNEVFSGFLPQLTLQGGYTYINNAPSMSLPIPGTQPFHLVYNDNYQIQASLNQVLFTSGQLYYGNRAMSRQVKATRLSAEAVRLKLARGVAEAYLGVLLAQDVLKARQESLQTAQAHLAQVQRRLDAGTASRFELLRSQVEVDNLVPTVSEAANTVELARIRLAQAMGLTGQEDLKLSDSLETTVREINGAEYLERAQKERPELLALAEARQAATDQSLSKRGAMLPSVMAFGTYAYQKPYVTLNDWEKNWTLGVGAKLTLFDGLKTYSSYQGARAKVQTINNTLAQTRDDIYTETKNALLSIKEAATRVQTTGANVTRAQEVVKIADESYIAGATTSLEVIDAELAATNARIAHLKALYDYRLSRVRLFAAVGDRQEIGR